VFLTNGKDAASPIGNTYESLPRGAIGIDRRVAVWQIKPMTLQEYLSQNEIPPSRLADKAGVPASTISRILSGDRKPGLEVMKKIMAATDGNVTPNDFLPVQEPPPAG